MTGDPLAELLGRVSPAHVEELVRIVAAGYRLELEIHAAHGLAREIDRDDLPACTFGAHTLQDLAQMIDQRYPTAGATRALVAERSVLDKGAR